MSKEKIVRIWSDDQNKNRRSTVVKMEVEGLNFSFRVVSGKLRTNLFVNVVLPYVWKNMLSFSQKKDMLKYQYKFQHKVKHSEGFSGRETYSIQWDEETGWIKGKTIVHSTMSGFEEKRREIFLPDLLYTIIRTENFKETPSFTHQQWSQTDEFDPKEMDVEGWECGIRSPLQLRKTLRYKN